MIMFMSVLLPDESQLCIDRIEIEEDVIALSVSSTNPTGLCPLCGTPSNRVHSHYQRHPADSAIAVCTVRLDMNIRKFFCDNSDCGRTIFTERLPSVVAPHARRTHRLADQQREVAFALGGKAGASLLTIMGMAVSHDTLLRLIRRAPEPELTTPRVLGVDEWAKRKGHSYGTILVDLETHRPVDLLPDESAESFAKWLREHPGIEVISRDRGTEYIKGATDGAPDAVQVADRCHLLNNLRDALKRMLESKCACLKAAADKPNQNSSEQEKLYASHEEQSEKNAESTDGSIVAEGTSDAPPKLTKAEKRKLERRIKRQERYEAVMELYGQGLSRREIARRLKLHRRTVSKYIKADKCPMYPERKRRSKLDPYMDYIQQRWESGCHNATQIWREIRKLGFDGSRGLVACWAAKKRQSLPQPSSPGSNPESPPKKEVAPWSASRAAWLLIRDEDDLEDDDKQALGRMKQADEKVAEAYALGQRFVQMVRERQSEALLPWLEDATQSGVEVLKQFAKGIKQDLDAVTNALSLPWSNGQTEGQVNRLKLIKRQMYGRANFDLLRRRVLATPLRY